MIKRKKVIKRKKISNKLITLIILFISATGNTFAINNVDNENNHSDTTKVDNKKYIGTLSGSFETNTTYYVDNEKDGVNSASDYKYGSNNYFKLDYVYKGFSAGVQGEWYPQPLVGYDTEYTGFAIPIKYIAWQNDNLSITVGDFYEQFGSGLILRTWEDRALGFNNSLGGARFNYNIKDIVRIKVLSGFARDYMDYSSTLVSGFDVSVSLSDIFKIDNHLLSLEASAVNRYESEFKDHFDADLYEEFYKFAMPKSLLSYSARFNYQFNSVSAKYEYVRKGEDLFTSMETGDVDLREGQAHLVELGYSANGLSTSVVLRYLDNIESAIYKTSGEVFMSNRINYIPSMTTQHTYSLASMNPYTPLGGGEMGGQFDIFYRVKKGTALGGKRGMKVHANYSIYHGIESATGTGERMFLYSDLTFDIEKMWSRKFQTTLFVSMQKNSLSVYIPDIVKRNIFVADITYKFTNKYSLRAELQYLSADSEDDDWVAAQLEFNIAPNWSVYVSDMFNYNGQQEHYAAGGFSYTHSAIRASLSYGNYKEGYICSGGVCRTVPAYNGVNLAVSIAF